MRTRTLLIFISLSLLLSIILPAPLRAQSDTRPNVIFILADDLGYGDLGCYGQEKLSTPNIDRLASEGMLFTDHYSGNTVCSPSRAVLMTGQPTGKCYLRGNVWKEAGAALDSSWTVLPEIFKKAGYATGAFGKWGLGITCEPGDQNPLSHGFDEFCGWKSQLIAHTYYPTSYVHNGREIPLDGETYVHDIIMDSALSFVRRNAVEGKPFFCYIPTAIPHAAMHAPRELHEKWRKVYSEHDTRTGIYGAGPGEKCPKVKNPIAGFAAMMEHLDSQVGHLLELLEELGADENTMLVFASDNGAHKEGGHDPDFWNSTGGLRGMKRDMHEGGIRTPLLVRWPSTVAPGSRSDHISAFHDFVPTMADLLGANVPALAEGISFLPELRGETQLEHEAIYLEFHKGGKLYSRALRMGKWKVFLKKNAEPELYDLEADPFETSDISDHHPGIMEEALRQMDVLSDPSALRK